MHYSRPKFDLILTKIFGMIYIEVWGSILLGAGVDWGVYLHIEIF